MMRRNTIRSDAKGAGIIDFGDAYFLDRLICETGNDRILNSLPVQNRDTLYCLLLYEMLEGRSEELISIWYRGSYASYLYPQADLSEEGRAQIREELKSSENPRILPSVTASLRSFIRNRRESPGTLFSMLRGVKARVGKSAIRPGAVSDDARKALEKFGMTIPLQVKIRGDQLIPIFGEVNSK